MKVLSEQAMIEVLTTDAALAAAQAELFETIAPLVCKNKGFLAYAVKEGLFVAEQINYNGRPAYIFWYHKSHDNGLWIDAIQTLDKTIPFKAAIVGVEILRKRDNCNYTRFMTTRGGMVNVCKQAGYVVEGVVMAKL